MTFAKHKRLPVKIKAMTRDEWNSYQRAWRAANKDKVSANNARYRKKNRRRLNAEQRDHRRICPEVVASWPSTQKSNSGWYRGNKEQLV